MLTFMIYSPMRVSPLILKKLAALTWIAGAMVLLLKGAALVIEARELRPGSLLNHVPLLVAPVIGFLKARFLFSNSCRKNLARIDTLPDPKLWQFFRPGFFLSLISMVLLGVCLSRLAHGLYGMLIGVSALDLSISVALLGSFHAFRGRKS